MKRVDYEHFSRFLMPYSPKARGEELYFCVNAEVVGITIDHDSIIF